MKLAFQNQIENLKGVVWLLFVKIVLHYKKEKQKTFLEEIIFLKNNKMMFSDILKNIFNYSLKKQ